MIARTINYNNSKLKSNSKAAKAETNKSNNSKLNKNNEKSNSNSNSNSITTKLQNMSSIIILNSKKNTKNCTYYNLIFYTEDKCKLKNYINQLKK